jgi:hypothetical protein
LIVEDFDSSFCLFDGCHLDKPIALGLVGVPVINNLNASYCADTLEEFFEFIFSCIVRKIAEIKSVGFDRGGSRSPTGGARGLCYTSPRFWSLTWSPFIFVGVISTSTLSGRSNGFLTKADKFQELLPPG